MDGLLFEKWVRELDRKFGFERRNATFVVENYPAYPKLRF